MLHRKSFVAAAKELGFDTPFQYHNLTKELIRSTPLEFFLARNYHGSILMALEDLFPEEEWLPWLMELVPPGFWQVRTNKRRYLDWLGAKLGYSRFERWYRLSHQGPSLELILFKQCSQLFPMVLDFMSNGGRQLAALSSESPLAIVQEAFPEFHWFPFLFDKTRKGYWSLLPNRRVIHISSLFPLMFPISKLCFRNIATGFSHPFHSLAIPIAIGCGEASS